MTAGGWKSTAQGASLKFSRNSLYLHLLNTIVMPQFRNMTPAEIAAVESLGSSAEAWSQVSVADDFTPFQLLQSHLEGKVVVGSGARIIRSRVCNYHIGEGALVEGVTALECRRRSTFGNGVGVATMNECGGRTVKIYDRLSAQAAYLMAVYRHRPQTMAALEKMVDDYAEARASQTGSVGKGSRIVGARFIREVRIGDNVTVDGCSILENGTVCDGAHIGVDVKAYDFIAAENARIDNGSIVERCFVGESCRLDKAFTAAESLFFANSHCENGEAASIFAGPYTVSHHKSSLLIAGMFSFFNAGSGSNQSNHLFKSGAVHQAVHLRGCKFASGAYIMSPALEGAFTMIMGHHSFHHDTSAFPYSYLVEKEGRSVLMPGANLTSYGAVRDIEKWPARDRRTIRRDVINFEEYNPYITSGMLRAVDTLHAIAEEDPDAPTYVHQKAIIRAAALKRGIGLYNRFIVAALGAMLDRGGIGGTLRRQRPLARHRRTVYHQTRSRGHPRRHRPRRTGLARRGGQPVQGLFRPLRRLRPQLGRRGLRIAAGTHPDRGGDRRGHRGGAQRPRDDAPYDRRRPRPRLLARHGGQLRPRQRRRRGSTRRLLLRPGT